MSWIQSLTSLNFIIQDTIQDPLKLLAKFMLIWMDLDCILAFGEKNDNQSKRLKNINTLDPVYNFSFYHVLLYIQQESH